MKSLGFSLAVFILFAAVSAAKAAGETAINELTPAQAKEFLIQGNNRFLAQDAGSLYAKGELNIDRRAELVKYGQRPFAAILSCSDSRVPPELLFNAGLGDIFVIRVAGNVLDPISTGSIEYANLLGVPLIVVMGHDHCGAVHAAIEGGRVSQNIEAIIKEIEPSLNAVKADIGHEAKEALQAAVESKNIDLMAAKLKNNPELKARLDAGELAIVSAKYSLASGKVEFF